MNIPLISGQLAKLHVKLETEDDFELYGGTTKAGFIITPERPESKNEWLVTIDEPEVAGKPLTRFDIYVRQMSSGREWVVLSGKLLVSPRSASVDADKLAPIEYNVTIPVVENAVDLTGAAIVTGIPGPRGYSAYEIAVMEGFEGTEAEWLEYMRQKTATLAVAQVTPLMERAETAANGAEAAKAEAEMQAENAETYMHTASTNAEKAKEHKNAAAEEVSKAAAEVQKAAAEVDKATQERETAAGHANAAAKSAQDALANQQGAEQAAQDAAQAKVAAQTAKTEAEAAKVQAQTAEGNAQASANAAADDKAAAETAKTGAQAAQSKAEQEASKAEQNAALLGDAALQGRNNTFEAGTTQTVNGIGVFNGEVVLNGDISGTGVEYLRAMEALRELQGNSKGVIDAKSGTRVAKSLSIPARDAGARPAAYYVPTTDSINTKACFLIDYDKSAPIEINFGNNYDGHKSGVYSNTLFEFVSGSCGNGGKLVSSAYIEGTHLYIKFSHARHSLKLSSSYFENVNNSMSVYDLGENETLKKTSKLLFFSNNWGMGNFKLVIWGLVGSNLEPVVAFQTGITYWGSNRLNLLIWEKATIPHISMDVTPELMSVISSKDSAVVKKNYETQNNDAPSNAYANVKAEGGEFVINFAEAAGCNWEIEELPEWITADVSEVENGGQLVLTVLPNDGAARSGRVRFKSIGNHAVAGVPCWVINIINQLQA